MSDAWVDIVARRLGQPILTTSDEVRFNCWRKDCGNGFGRSGGGDSNYHMYVNPTTGKFFCQRCQRGGTLEYLSKVLGIESPEKSLRLWDTIMNQFLYGTEETVVEEKLQLPDEYVKMFPGTQAHEYLRKRGILDNKIEHYNIGFGTGDLSNRVIFPDYDKEGNLVYWAARTYGTHKAKYKNAKAARQRQVFNLGRMQARGKRGRIVICEGPISAIVAGYDAVATYGKYITGDQISRLVAFNAEEYVVAIDGDAMYESVSLATRLFRRGLPVRFVRFKQDEDPASIGPVEIRRRICTAMKWDRWSSLEVMVDL